MPGELYLIRHGETQWSRDLRHTSRTDVPLTPQGERSARDVGSILALRIFALVLASPMQRAIDTCRLSGYRPAIDEDLCEWDYGSYEGKTTAQIQAERPGWTIWNGNPPNGETAAQVSARADRIIARALACGGDVALFGHGHVSRVLAARWLGLEADGGRLLALSTGSVSVLGWERDTRVIRLWNQTAGDHTA
jgi:probable phosphoglycerate mutase